MKALTSWTYKGQLVLPADRNSSGIRWYCNAQIGVTLRSDTKAGMRVLITQAVEEMLRPLKAADVK